MLPRYRLPSGTSGGLYRCDLEQIVGGPVVRRGDRISTEQ
jgi:hypothetical protein